MEKIYLVLANGKVFQGYSFGAEKEVVGEIVFTTGMGSYIETLTDPTYCGQIVVQTFPMIGNYGMIEEDLCEKPTLAGYVVREWCERPSNFRSDYDIDTFLKKNDIPGIYGLDTREITRNIREFGVMNAKICKEIPENIGEIKDFKVENYEFTKGEEKAQIYECKEDKKYNVTLIDFGDKKDIIHELNKRGCDVKVVPLNYSFEKIISDNPDGILISNGNGNPKENETIIQTVKSLLGNVPMFGIGLGHLLLSLANGGDTAKLKYGHRGDNQPVFHHSTGRTYITSQNHSYVVIKEKATKNDGKVTFTNSNDGTPEGVEYTDKKAFSVQFFPKNYALSHDTSFLYDDFIKLMGGNK